MPILDWFKFTNRSVYSLAFAIQRITGIILLFYLCLHLIFLTSLTDRTGETYESLIAVTVSKQFLLFDILLVLCGVFHGINGLRVIVHEFGFVYEYRKVVIGFAFFLVIVAWLYASYVMYCLVGG